jgi:anti-anti-sigma factor
VSSFNIRIVHEHDTTVVEVAGALDMASAPQLTSAMVEAAEHERKTVTIDAAGITFCDSTGLRSLLGAPGPRPLVLRSPSDVLGRLLDLTGTGERFRIVDGRTV